MSKAPSMPMFWDAYLADTTHLSTEEHGAYLLLLAAMWRRNGSVPDDDADNARILGLSKAKWRKVKARLSGFLIIEDGEISQKNLRKIWENTQEKIEKNRANGAVGGRAAARKNKDLGQASAKDSLQRKASIPEPEPEPDKEPIGSLFNDFWSVVPRKVAKEGARKAFKAALKKTDSATIIAGMRRYAATRHGENPKYTAHPATWLNEGRWDDELPAFNAIPGGRGPVDQQDRSRKIITAAAGGVFGGKDFG